MKGVIKFLGWVFLIILVCIGVLAVKGTALDKESKQYADAALPAIISNWDMKEVDDRASPEFKATVKKDELGKLFFMFRRLGRLKEYKGCHGSSNMSYTSKHGVIISASYIGDAEFAAGPAEIRLSLIKHGDQWQVLGIRVNSKMFLSGF